jgi:hypothetical protein
LIFHLSCKGRTRKNRKHKDITVSNHDGATKVNGEEIQHIVKPVIPGAFMVIAAIASLIRRATDTLKRKYLPF